MRNLTTFLSLAAIALTWRENAGMAEDSPKNLRDQSEIVKLAVGDSAPMFKSVDECGREWASADHVGRKFLVIYFYPADFTTGCIKQAEAFRDAMNALADKGVTVVGVSGDSVQNHGLFKRTWKLNYPLLSDESAVVAAKFGVPVKAGGKVVPYGPDRKRLLDENGDSLHLERKTTFARWTIVVGKDGKILYKNVVVRPAEDARQVLELVEKLEAGSESGRN
jgi:peroxiredoxin Q/BCP